VNTLFARSLEQLRSSPGVESAAVALSLPFERALNQGWRFNGSPRPAVEAISLTYVTSDYFRALRIPVRRGRVFDDRDIATSPRVMVVNDAFVRQYSLDRDVVGRLVKLGNPQEPSTEIVGVVADIQQVSTFGNLGPIAALPATYVPATQVADAGFTLVHGWFQPSWIVRTHGPIAAIPMMRRVLHDIDPRLTFNKFRTIEDIQRDATTTPRVLASLLAALAAIALALSVVGVYGLVANGVAERRRELGVRIALGSSPLQTLSTAASAAIGLAICGAAIGLVLSFVVSGILRQVVFGVTVTDPVTMLAAAAIILGAASAAAVLPAWRMLRLNLSTVLNSP
jgi:hypothetical protein